MPQAQLSQISAPSFPPLTFKTIPVLTTEMLAQAYEVEPHQIRHNFKNNRDRFIEGKHFYSLSGEELKDFKNCVENFYSVEIGKRTANLVLWTERGCARHAKSLNTDRAWDMFELLEETFFAVVKAEPKEATQDVNATLTPDQQCTIQSIVKAKVDAVPSNLRQRGLYPQIYQRFNNHFRIAKYCQLPQSKLAEAIEYLVKMDVRVSSKKLDQPAETPALPLAFGWKEKVDGKYRAYLEKVEKFRAETLAERERLYREGMTLFDISRTGGDLFYVCCDFLKLWLEHGLLDSSTSVFDGLLRHNRAPVMLAEFFNTHYDDVGKYIK